MSLRPKSVFEWNYWNIEPQDQIELTCFMPNSIYIPLKVNVSSTLIDIKQTLWLEAAKYPLSEDLQSKSCYVYEFINSLAIKEQVSDETIRLSDLKPSCGVLRLEKKPEHDDVVNILNRNISVLIGKDLRQYDALQSEEIDSFRLEMRLSAQRQADEIAKYKWSEKLLKLYPTRLASCDSLPSWLAKRLGGSQKFKLQVIFDEKIDSQCTSFNFNVAYTKSPQKILEHVLKLKWKASSDPCIEADNLLLKVCGQSEFLITKCPIIRFMYIQETLAAEMLPTFVVIDKGTILKELEEFYSTPVLEFVPLHYKSLKNNKSKTVPSWKIHAVFKCTVLEVERLNIDVSRPSEVAVRGGIFHGGKLLCEHQTTNGASISTGVNGAKVWKWNEDLIFPITLSNIPRMARLCFVIYEKFSKGKCKDVKIPLAWVNTTIFEYNNRLKGGMFTMNMWQYHEDTRANDLLHPLGTVALNPNTDQCVIMKIKYKKYGIGSPISYAPDPELTFSMEQLSLKCDTSDKVKNKIAVIMQNPFYEMHEQDWRDLWALRMSLRILAPNLLPKLLQCTEWGNKENVACVNHLLNIWPRELPVECSLEMLDYAYSEPAVRKFALHCLDKLSDDELSLYLLQLVQALKHESYLMCDLVTFILKRAFNNTKIGHFVFWQLRSEMQFPSVNVRFGLILEAYLRGSQQHIPTLLKQVSCLQRLIIISQTMRQMKDIATARARLPIILGDTRCSEHISQFTNMLNPACQCKRVIADKCRVMDSKMRPLYLVFENADMYGEEISIILKNGDDLRQDMFTLQMLKIMDRLWKDAGYDFRLNLYGCIAMEYRVGMIEVVLDASTIASIQKEKVKNVLNLKTESMLSWLKDHNSDEVSLDKAVSEFMLSCAGYCVATYILGVADRHSDNIMVKKSGQLFHIDFGHFLGNFKEKFGFVRERVPFVLAHEFVTVINKGQKKSKEFDEFRKLCENAFLVLRKNGTLIVSLFAMMISTGLPELSSEKDLQYLRETLALECSEERAIAHFHSKFDEAMNKDFYTKFNWWIHNRTKNN